MPTQNKSNTFQAFWVAMGSLSSILLSLLSAAILSRYFDQAEYGTYKQVLYVYNSLVIIFTAGLPRVYGYFLPKYGKSEGLDIINKITGILFLSGLFFSLSLYFGSYLISVVLKNPDLEIGLKIFAPIPFFLLPTMGLDGIFSTYRKTEFLAIYNVFSRLLMLSCILVPVIYYDAGYQYALYGWGIGSFITLILALYFRGLPFKGVKKKKSSLQVSTIFYYSLPLVTASLSGIAIKAADQFYISRYYGVETFAVFSNGFIQLPFVAMVTGAIGTILMPRFSELVESGKEEIARLFKESTRKSSIIIYPTVIFFFFFAEDFIIVLFSNLYEESAPYFRIALIINFFNVVQFTPLILALGLTKFYARIHFIFMIIAWTGNLLLINLINRPISSSHFFSINNNFNFCYCIYLFHK